jgi:hypothetical protein
MKAFLRVAVALVCFLAGVPFLFLGVLTIPRDWNAVRELRKDERDAVSAAVRYVDEHRKAVGRYPTIEEFEAWADGALRSLPLQWCDLRYYPPLVDRTDYSFAIWDGDCHSTWRSEPKGSTTMAIDPVCYFVFGSKIADLFVFLGASSLLLGIAGYIAKPLISGKAR